MPRATNPLPRPRPEHDGRSHTRRRGPASGRAASPAAPIGCAASRSDARAFDTATVASSASASRPVCAQMPAGATGGISTSRAALRGPRICRSRSPRGPVPHTLSGQVGDIQSRARWPCGSAPGRQGRLMAFIPARFGMAAHPGRASHRLAPHGRATAPHNELAAGGPLAQGAPQIGRPPTFAPRRFAHRATSFLAVMSANGIEHDAGFPRGPCAHAFGGRPNPIGPAGG